MDIENLAAPSDSKHGKQLVVKGMKGWKCGVQSVLIRLSAQQICFLFSIAEFVFNLLLVTNSAQLRKRYLSNK
jgi:hypothetical protein